MSANTSKRRVNTPLICPNEAYPGSYTAAICHDEYRFNANEGTVILWETYSSAMATAAPVPPV